MTADSFLQESAASCICELLRAISKRFRGSILFLSKRTSFVLCFLSEFCLEISYKLQVVSSAKPYRIDIDFIFSHKSLISCMLLFRTAKWSFLSKTSRLFDEPFFVSANFISLFNFSMILFSS